MNEFLLSQRVYSSREKLHLTTTLPRSSSTPHTGVPATARSFHKERREEDIEKNKIVRCGFLWYIPHVVTIMTPGHQHKVINIIPSGDVHQRCPSLTSQMTSSCHIYPHDVILDGFDPDKLCFNI